MRIIDVTYYTHTECAEPAQVLALHKTSVGYTRFIKDKAGIEVVKHLNYEGFERIDGVEYAFFKSRNSFFHIPFKTHRYIKSHKPSVVLIQGLHFPLQLIFLRFILSRKCKIIAKHHGERPLNGIKKTFQKIADRYIDAYLFTSLGNAKPWVDEGIISTIDKCHEVLEASSYFTRQDKEYSRIRTGISGNDIFLWVGRLEHNKDPMTVLKGYELYLSVNTGTRLYMIYQENDLLKEVQQYISNSSLLKQAVTLVGQVNHSELPYWFSAADYFISGSHREGSGYALIEAMACGCMPVVTDIPSFKKIAGEYGFYYTAGEPESLFEMLKRLSPADKIQKKKIIDYFNEYLSFKKIANDIWNICNKLRK